jgi:putative membrane protein
MRIPLILGALTLAVTTQTLTPAAQAQQQQGQQAAQEQQSPRLTDELFVTKAGQANLHEIQLSRMALERASNDATRQLAQQMIDDHTQANAELARVAAQLKVAAPEQLDVEQQTVMSRLDGEKPDDFDAEYVDQMRESHERAIALYASVAEAETVSPPLRQLAKQLLPKLRQHLEAVETLRENL